MIPLDDEWLVSLGLGVLPAPVKNEFLAHAYSTLEMRVGMVLAELMDDGQLSAFESFINANDQEGALAFLNEHLPDYKNVVREQFDALTEEIRPLVPQILALEQGQDSAAS